MEDPRSAQTIHLYDLSTNTRQEDQDEISVKAASYDAESKEDMLIQLKSGPPLGEGGNMDASRHA
jgi:hypothetical protein